MSTDQLANRRFLVVDDEQFIRALVTRFLERAGAADVVQARDGGQAIVELNAYDMTFDAVITDVNMTPVNGIALLRAIRTGANGLKRNTPVVMLTVHSEAELVAEALALDADAFVLKPVERTSFVERVMRVLAHPGPIGSAASYRTAGIAPAPQRPETERMPAAASPEHRATTHVERAGAHMTALADVKVDSVLAQDVYVVGSSRLLLAAPTVLSRALLDRLTDLREIHDAYTHLVVFEPA